MASPCRPPLLRLEPAQTRRPWRRAYPTAASFTRMAIHRSDSPASPPLPVNFRFRLSESRALRIKCLKPSQSTWPRKGKSHRSVGAATFSAAELEAGIGRAWSVASALLASGPAGKNAGRAAAIARPAARGSVLRARRGLGRGPARARPRPLCRRTRAGRGAFVRLRPAARRDVRARWEGAARALPRTAQELAAEAAIRERKSARSGGRIHAAQPRLKQLAPAGDRPALAASKGRRRGVGGARQRANAERPLWVVGKNAARCGRGRGPASGRRHASQRTRC